jgi:ABC-type antimicrobial peptide transport system permease subunit
VARDGKYQRLSEPPRSFVYRCLAQQTPGTFSLLVASELDEASLLDDLRRTLEELERDLPILSIITLREHMALNLFPTRLGALLLLTFGLLGLILAAAGLYGVVAHAVSKRTREIGVRVALGARSVDIVRLVLSQGLALVAAGLGIGFGLAFLATRLLVSLLYGVSSHDLLSYLGVTALFLAVAGLAILLPARRALRVDPVVALRSE